MIKVFNIRDLIKYFIKILIPLIAIFVIAKTLFSVNNVPIDIKYEKAYFFCLDDNIPQIQNKKANDEKEELHKFLLAQELHILKGIKKRSKCY